MNIDSTHSRSSGDILVVDDNTSNLNFLSDVLTKAGYQVRPATNGELALRSIAAKLPELIVLDYKMPGMNGIEMCHRLKSDPKAKDIPVIFLSAMGETDLKVKALEAGGIDYVTKPVEPSEILAKIDNHLHIYKLQKRLKKQTEELTREIKERKQTEQKLARFSRLLESSLNEIYIFDSETFRFIDANLGARKNLGYSLEELQNMTPMDFKPQFTADSFAELIAPLRSGAEQKIVFQTVHRRKDKTLYDVGVHLQLMSEEPSVFVAIILDITEQIKMREQLFLNEKMKTIAGLAAGVAHEINTPLSAILQSHQLIELGLSPDEPDSRELAAECNIDLLAVQDYFKKNEMDFFMAAIRESALKAAHIIKSLLNFSRPHEGSFSIASLEDIIACSLLLGMADYDLKKKYDIMNVEFIKEFSPNLPGIMCVTTEIEQVILNLIKNSVQAMAEKNLREKPCITLRTKISGNAAMIEVEDNGPGMTEDVKKHIFDPFFTTKDVGNGTGLGLSVSHAIIVDKHKGKIYVESMPGQGTRFIVELPLSQEN